MHGLRVQGSGFGDSCLVVRFFGSPHARNAKNRVPVVPKMKITAVRLRRNGLVKLEKNKPQLTNVLI